MAYETEYFQTHFNLRERKSMNTFSRVILDSLFCHFNICLSAFRNNLTRWHVAPPERAYSKAIGYMIFSTAHSYETLDRGVNAQIGELC